MSYDLSPRSGELLPSDARRTARAVSRFSTSAQLRVAQADADTDVAAAISDDLTHITGKGMANVLRVAQLQKQLELMAPEVSGYLSLLAGDHALQMRDVQADLAATLRRVGGAR